MNAMTVIWVLIQTLPSYGSTFTSAVQTFRDQNSCEATARYNGGAPKYTCVMQVVPGRGG